MDYRGGGVRSWVSRSIRSWMDHRGVMDGGMHSVMHGGVHSVMNRGMMSHVVDRDRVSQGVRSVVTMSHNSAVMSVMDHVGRDVSRGSRMGQSNQSQHTRKSLG